MKTEQHTVENKQNDTYATIPALNRLALIFDFDETLAPDTYAALLAHCGYDPDAFEAEKVQPLLDDGWDKKLARFYALRRETELRDDFKLTAETCAEVGRNLELYPGVSSMFERLTACARAIVPDVEIVFCLLTAGMLTIPRATAIWDRFDLHWGGALHFGEDDGNLASVKRIVDHPDKIRYLLKLCKGMDLDSSQINNDVYREIPDEDWYIHLNQTVYVGDGDSDMPVFAYLAENDGLAISVYEAEHARDWEGYEDVHDQRRVQNLAPADYREGSELMNSLTLAVESVCKQIALRQKGEGQ